MASMQCYKPSGQTCNQGQYYDSSMGGWVNKNHATQPPLVNTETQCTTKTQTYYPDTGYGSYGTPKTQAYYLDNGMGKTQTYYGQSQTTNPNNGYGGAYGYSNSHTHTNYVEQTKTHGYGSGSTTVCVDPNKVHGYRHGLGHTHSSNGMMAASGCHGSKRGEHKRRGLFQKLRDGGDSSCSSSDSESDDEHCGRRRPNYC